MSNQWFRMYSEFATDPKVQMMSEADQRRLTMLFCLRCNGHVTLQDKEVTFLLRISNDEWIKTKSEFIELGFISSTNELLNWDKRQFASDSSAARVARHRERLKNEQKKCNVTVTPQNRTEQNRTDTEIKDLSSSQAELNTAGSDDVKKEVCSVPEAKRQSERKTAIVEIFEYWKLIMNHGAAKLDVKREKAIGDALKTGYSVDELKAAIRGCSVTPFNCGENDRNTRFDGLGIIFKNADQIDRFIQNSIHPVPAKTGIASVGERQRKVLN
ncbi:MAG: hypothetical protein ACXWAT_00245 [Methylobacter sp.]